MSFTFFIFFTYNDTHHLWINNSILKCKRCHRTLTFHFHKGSILATYNFDKNHTEGKSKQDEQEVDIITSGKIIRNGWKNSSTTKARNGKCLRSIAANLYCDMASDWEWNDVIDNHSKFIFLLFLMAITMAIFQLGDWFYV